jgi:hypothetical protein
MKNILPFSLWSFNYIIFTFESDNFPGVSVRHSSSWTKAKCWAKSLQGLSLSIADRILFYPRLTEEAT